MFVSLGDKVKDKVSGFEGVVVSKHSYLNGCDRVSVQPFVDKDGKLPESETFDEPQLEVVEVGYAEEGDKIVGGPEKYKPKKRYDGKR